MKYKKKQTLKRKWQNLLYKKCPNCERVLEDMKHYLLCSNKDIKDINRSCFFIKKEVAAEYLLNPNHPANFCLSPEERERIKNVVKDY